MLLSWFLACSNPTPPPAPSPGTTTFVPTEEPADTGDTDVVDPATEPPEEQGCVVNTAPEIVVGDRINGVFEEFDRDPQFMMSGQRMDISVQTTGLDLKDPITTVFRTNRPGSSTTDTVAARVLQCGNDGYGWIHTEILVPEQAIPGSELEVQVSFTDARGMNASASVTGTLVSN